jgi:hypothetical protein
MVAALVLGLILRDRDSPNRDEAAKTQSNNRSADCVRHIEGRLEVENRCPAGQSDGELKKEFLE